MKLNLEDLNLLTYVFKHVTMTRRRRTLLAKLRAMRDRMRDRIKEETNELEKSEK